MTAYGVMTSKTANCFYQQATGMPMGGYIWIALAIITLVGSFVASGLLSSQWGAYALIVAEVGIVSSIICFALGRYISICASKNERKLPSLFDVKINAGHPLLKPVSERNFLRDYKGIKILDDELLDIPVEFWINPDREAVQGQQQIDIMNDPVRQKQTKLIDKRLEELDTTLRFKERFKNHLLDTSMIAVRDLLPSWNQSRLKLALITDDELSKLHVSSLAPFNPVHVHEVLGKRIRQISQNKKPATTISPCLVVDLPKVKATQINTSPDSFHPVTLLLIEAEELQKVATGQLSTAQIESLYATMFRDDPTLEYLSFVTRLTISQVNNSIHLVQNKKLFENLSEDQILNLDYSKINQTIFDVLFNVFDSRVNTLLDKISDRQLYAMRKLVGAELREKMTPRQLKIIDGKLRVK